MTIEVGSFVIINEVDAPTCKLVAQVTELHQTIMISGKEGQIVVAKYLAEYPCRDKCSAEIDRVTLVSAFGVDVTITNDSIICEKNRESIAKYEDGGIREWQDHRKIACEPLRHTFRKKENQNDRV